MGVNDVAFTGSVRLLYGSYANLLIAFCQNRSASHQCNDKLLSEGTLIDCAYEVILYITIGDDVVI